MVRPAAFLSLGALTGLDTLLIDRARSYCAYMMQGYLAGALHSTLSVTPQALPDRSLCAMAGEWEWNESLTNEQARFLLPLAWLVRVQDTAEHRGWLDRLVTDLLVSQDRLSGAIKQEFGTGKEAGRCGPCAPASNAAYGSGEGPIMHDGTEPLSDALYTLSFAIAGLREAYGATGIERYAAAETRLAEFLVRTQVVSAKHPELSGAWFRAFDFERWECVQPPKPFALHFHAHVVCGSGTGLATMIGDT